MFNLFQRWTARQIYSVQQRRVLVWLVQWLTVRIQHCIVSNSCHFSRHSKHFTLWEGDLLLIHHQCAASIRRRGDSDEDNQKGRLHICLCVFDRVSVIKVSTGDLVKSFDLPKTSALEFSPLNRVLATWQQYTSKSF